MLSPHAAYHTTRDVSDYYKPLIGHLPYHSERYVGVEARITYTRVVTCNRQSLSVIEQSWVYFHPIIDNREVVQSYVYGRVSA